MSRGPRATKAQTPGKGEAVVAVVVVVTAVE